MYDTKSTIKICLTPLRTKMCVERGRGGVGGGEGKKRGGWCGDGNADCTQGVDKSGTAGACQLERLEFME